MHWMKTQVWLVAGQTEKCSPSSPPSYRSTDCEQIKLTCA